MEPIDELQLLRARVGELEQRVEHLRVSRRVLMNLLEKVEREKVSLVHRLEKENVRLQRDNKRFAKWIFSKNREIVELQEKMESQAQKA
ncbi:MAG: translation initiation factor 2 [Bacillota bacterium]|nr:translation initiation factor 2 [Bacillota bacterium]MDP4158350.1 translation initiation factor 2 [Bacillota bacterium]